MTGIPARHVATVESVERDDRAESDHGAYVLGMFQQYGPALYRFSRSVLRRGSDAEDVVQDTFVKLIRHLRAGGSRANVKAWLFTVAANDCRTRLRGRFRWMPWSPERDDRTVPFEEERDNRGAMMRALRSLGPRDRLLLSLRVQGLSYRDIAAAAGIRASSVGRLLARAVTRWKERVAAEGGRDGLSE